MTLYDTLGVEPQAPPEKIKRAYRKKAQKHHPDKEGGNTEAFRAIQLAYEVLGDEERRRRYDETGRADALPDLEREARETLRTLFLAVIDRIDIDHNDVLQAVREHLQRGEEVLRAEKHKLEKTVAKRERVLKKLKRKGEGALLEDAVSAVIQADKAKLEDFVRHERIAERVRELLEPYSYEFTKPATRFYQTGLSPIFTDSL